MNQKQYDRKEVQKHHFVDKEINEIFQKNHPERDYKNNALSTSNAILRQRKDRSGACMHLSHKTAVYHPLFHITLFEF